LHFVGDLLSRKVDLVNFGREGGNLIKGATEARQTYAFMLKLAIVQDEYPLVSLSINVERHEVLMSVFDRIIDR